MKAYSEDLRERVLRAVEQGYPRAEIIKAVRNLFGNHQTARVQQLIEDRGCYLLFLPAYSPDFSPIEETFSKVKAFLRRTEARTRETLQEAIAQALLTVTPQDACGWFGRCGYAPLNQRKEHCQN